MNAKDYLSGVYLDTKKFSKKETIELMEDYFKYKTEYNEQLVKNLTIPDVVKSLPIDEIQDYHIKRWANGLETGASMQEIRNDMIIAKRAIDLGKTLKEREIK